MVAHPLTPEYAVLSGLTLTSFDPDLGVTIVMGSLAGWGAPPARLSAENLARRDGVWIGDSFLAARNIAASGWVHADSPAAANSAVDRIIAAATLADTTFTVVAADGSARTCEVRRSGEVLVSRLADRSLSWSLQLIAPDPRKHGAPLTGTTGLPMASGGLTVPHTVPYVIASTVVSGQVHLDNPGNLAGRVVVRIDGPITAPVVTHVNSGRQLVFSSALALGAGEFVVVDMDAHSVLAQGQASRAGWVTSRGWSSFEPGVNTWALSAAVHDAGTMTVTATPAWE